MQFKIKRRIEAPAEAVFDIATDLESAPESIGGITKMELLTEGPVGLGTRFRETRVFMKREASEEMEVTRFERPHGYAFSCDNHGCHYHTEYELTPDGAGTELSMTFDAIPKTIMAKALAFMMKPMIKMCLKETEKDMDDLKMAIEAKHAGPS